MKREFSLTKDYTEIIKGVAILLMLFHHFFGFPEWYVEGVSYIGIPLRANTLEFIMGRFGHICVALFAFLTGYGMFFSYKSGNIIKKSFKKGVSFLVCYWLILFGVAIPVNLALGKTDITPLLILKNMFAYDATLVSFAWYVRFYLALLVTLPFFYRLMTPRAAVTLPLFLICPAVITYYLGTVSWANFYVGKLVYFSMEYFLWVTCALSGLCFAKYDLFGKIGKIFARFKGGEIFVCAALVLVLMYLRAYKRDTLATEYYSYFSWDSIYAPVFVFLVCRVVSVFPEFVRSFLRLMGKHSMNIWFLHSLFFFRTAELMKYAYAPRVSILIIAWVIILCLPVSAALNAVSGLILKKIK